MALETSVQAPFMLLSEEELLAMKDMMTREAAWDGMNLLRAKFVPALADFVSLALLAYWKKSVPADNNEALRNLRKH